MLFETGRRLMSLCSLSETVRTALHCPSCFERNPLKSVQLWQSVIAVLTSMLAVVCLSAMPSTGASKSKCACDSFRVWTCGCGAQKPPLSCRLQRVHGRTTVEGMNHSSNARSAPSIILNPALCATQEHQETRVAQRCKFASHASLS